MVGDFVQEAEDEVKGDGFVLDRKMVAKILFAVDTDDRDALVALMEPMHAADIADLLEQINAFDRGRLIRLYDREFDGEILSELDETLREEVITILTPQVLAEAVRELDSDDVVDLIEDLEAAQQETILDALSESERTAVQQSLTYPEFSAGRLMQREVVMAPEFWSVGEAIDFLRSNERLPEQFYHIVLVDPKLRPVANVTLGRLMSSRRDVTLKSICEENFYTIPVARAEGEVAYAFNQYHLISAPVVDENDRLVGVITIDDAMQVLDEENEEDILRLAGVDGESRLSDRVVDTVKRRLPWLAVNLVTAVLASLVIAQFEVAIAQIVALAVLMPIVASMGGNAGTQSLTVAVRALATKDLTGANLWRVVRREGVVGLINGVALCDNHGNCGIDLVRLSGPCWGDCDGNGDQSRYRRIGRNCDPRHAGENRRGPGIGLGGVCDNGHRCSWFLCVFGAGCDGVAMTLEDRKRAARRAAFAARKAAHQFSETGQSALLQQVLRPYRARPLAGYMPIRTEIDPRAAMAEATAYGPVGVPVITAEHQPLEFAYWAPDCRMEDGAFGAQIPANPVFFEPEVIIVPLVAFTRSGGRLGYGGGFYDRTLERLRAKRQTIAIGFAFAAQELPDLPLEPTDQPLDVIVTETEVIRP